MPNGSKKKRIWFLFVALMFIAVIIIIWLIAYLAMTLQSKLINDYIIKVEFTKYQSISDAVAELKRNDLQEIFRESLIIDSLLSLAINYPSYISSSYITYSNANKLMSSYEWNQTWSSTNPIYKMVYLLLPKGSN